MSDDDWLGRRLPPDPEWKRRRRWAEGVIWAAMGALTGLVAAGVVVALGLFATSLFWAMFAQ